ncbi:hypothetical protein OUZ56_032252 [Daphnia magna]|uniref:Uncharacterized protein n=1 Tax=Daphnia magna TaxID=35525 RepID=A0ABQ9ZXE1_9CRUS|nr:hypothetical protein OUZ56_032252 [Daphnia magna]
MSNKVSPLMFDKAELVRFFAPEAEDSKLLLDFDPRIEHCSSLLAEEFRLLPEIRLLQGDEQQTIHKQ